MKLPSPARREMGENLIPLINVVFLLLIFFMLAGVFATPDLFRIDPAQSAAGERGDDRDHVLLLDADGRLAFQGEALEADALTQRLDAFRAQHPQAPLKLKADAGVKSPVLLDTLDRLRDAGVERVVLLTSRRTD